MTKGHVICLYDFNGLSAEAWARNGYDVFCYDYLTKNNRTEKFGEGHKHPFFPQYIEARDAYSKKTCYWTGGGFVMPKKKPVYCAPGYSKQYLKLGGKSAKTKRIRSMSPRGIAEAIYEANKKG